MYIRRTHTNNSSTGERYYTFRLVASQRVDGKPRQMTLLNLGRHFAVDQDLWASLCVRIEQLLSHQTELLPIELPLAVEKAAQRIAAQLIEQRAAISKTALADEGHSSPAEPSVAPVESVAAASADLQAVDVNSLELTRPRTVGVEQVGLWTMQQLNFIELLTGLGINGAHIAAIVGSIIGRMAGVGSELATHNWLMKQSALGELLEVDYASLPLMTMYRAADALWKHGAQIEQTLFTRLTDLFGFATTITLYDLTTTYFEGEVPHNTKARRGRSKETCPEQSRRERTDCPLVTLGLVLDGSGFPLGSQVFPGNASEPATLALMLDGLQGKNPVTVKPVVIMDAGIASAANIAWLIEHGYQYLVVSRERPAKDPRDQDRAVMVRKTGHNSVAVYREIDLVL